MNSHTLRNGRRLGAAALPAGLLVSSLVGLLAGLLTLGAAMPLVAAPAATMTLRGHVPAASFDTKRLGAVDDEETVELALVLPLRNQAQLTSFIRAVQNPSSSQYGRYLTSEQFRQSFSPTQAEYNAVAAFARARGLRVEETYANRLMVSVSGTAAQVEKAFNTKLSLYQAKDGRQFRAPSVEPSIPTFLSISGVVGLDNLPVAKRHAVTPTAGTGPTGGRSPSEIRTAYNLASSSLTGSGQTVALFELDGYEPSDITAYTTKFGLREVPREDIRVGGSTGAVGANADEVTLDIEMVNALAPGLDKLLVYQSVNTSAGLLTAYARIADDNRAAVVSTSWGATESALNSSTIQSENSIFQQMAAQGQSMLAAAGDSGAYDNGSSLGVNDPAAQPYVTGVGGTTLATTEAGAWSGESVWNAGSTANGAGGGGISSVWSLPEYQNGLATTANKGSSTLRNVPDVALAADPYSGYSVYADGKWACYGGTSCGAPLWAAFIALANQARVEAGKPNLGFLNTTLYSVGAGSRRSVSFHDIADGSTNLVYPATTGYDLATGLGTLNGANLLVDLTGSSTSNYSINGTVTVNGGGLSGVTISLSNGATTTTSTAGTYTLTGLSAGTYTVTPTLSGHLFSPTSRSVTISATNLTGIDFVATDTTASYRISGSILFNGSGLSGVTVTGGGQSATTSASGAYTLSGLSAGTYTVTPRRTGYSFSPEFRTVTITSANQGGVSFTATASGGNYSISGSVTMNGSGLPNVTVALGTGQSVITGSTGSFTLSGLAAGTYTMTPALTGYNFSPTSRSVTISGADRTGITFTATAQTRNISGVVTINGLGLGGVTVTAAGFSAVTSGSGAYTLTGLGAGSYTVSASLSGYTFSPPSQPVTITTSDVTGANFTATTAGTTLTSFQLAKSFVKGGKSVSATVRFSARLTSATYLTITSSNTRAVASKRVKVPKGKAGLTFSLTTRSVSSNSLVTLTAYDGVTSLTVNLTVR